MTIRISGIYQQPRIRQGEWGAQNSLGFCDTNGSPYLSQTIRHSDSQQKKRTGRIVDFAVKLKENEKRDKYRDFRKELKKTMEHEVDGDTNCNRCLRNNPQRFGKWIRRHRNRRTLRDLQNISIFKISQNTKKSPRELRGLTVTQTPVKVHQLTLVWKIKLTKTNNNKRNN